MKSQASLHHFFLGEKVKHEFSRGLLFHLLTGELTVHAVQVIRAYRLQQVISASCPEGNQGKVWEGPHSAVGW